jgi:hypothetical protein
MRTSFFYEAKTALCCNRCKGWLPVTPLTVVPDGVSHMMADCPHCGERERFDRDRVVSALTAFVDTDTLLDAWSAPDEVRPFDLTYRSEHTWKSVDTHVKLGGPERCVRCNAVLPLIGEPPRDRTTAVRCTSCEKDTHFDPPPPWLRDPQLVLTHLMTTGEAAPSDDPRFFLRLKLQSSALNARSAAITAGVVFLGLALIALAGMVILTLGGHPAGLFLILGVLAFGLVGGLLLRVGVLNRRRRRGLIAQLVAAEHEEAELAAAARSAGPLR